MQVLSATTVSNPLGIATIAVALAAALLTALSFYFNASQTWKQNRLNKGMAAYNAALAWQNLYDAAARGELTGAGALAARLRKVRTETEYHLVSLWGEAQEFGEPYHDYVDALREVYERPLLVALSSSEGGDRRGLPQVSNAELEKVDRARLVFLGKLKWMASSYLPFYVLSAASSSLRRKEGSRRRTPPDWLAAKPPGRDSG
jgi:hypothetical protein